METNLTIRARFFSHFPVETRKVIVEDDGTIRVWDDVAGHYTVCHSLTRADQRRIRKLAAKAASRTQTEPATAGSTVRPRRPE